MVTPTTGTAAVAILDRAPVLAQPQFADPPARSAPRRRDGERPAWRRCGLFAASRAATSRSGSPFGGIRLHPAAGPGVSVVMPAAARRHGFIYSPVLASVVPAHDPAPTADDEAVLTAALLDQRLGASRVPNDAPRPLPRTGSWSGQRRLAPSACTRLDVPGVSGVFRYGAFPDQDGRAQPA